ncbi:MAG: DUF5058 family protein [Oscillospiraceae bacterium]|nr:DUF5058 family protein [Oscillospiraceae bacterium]
MTVQSQLNSPFLYLLCGSIILFIALVSLFFLIRAYKAGKAMGLDTAKMKRAITASATFTLLPSVGILLGVIALSGSLGVPWPWLRLSVIGALHYETQVATAAAERVGLGGLSASSMTAQAFVTICLLMSLCIMWGMVFSSLFNKRYLRRLNQGSKKGGGVPGFGDKAMTAMFIGLICAYLGSYLGGFISGGGLFSFGGSWLPLAVVLAASLAMAGFLWLSEKKKLVWVESFSIAGSMLLAMACAVLLGKLQ